MAVDTQAHTHTLQQTKSKSKEMNDNTVHRIQQYRNRFEF